MGCSVAIFVMCATQTKCALSNKIETNQKIIRKAPYIKAMLRVGLHKTDTWRLMSYIDLLLLASLIHYTQIATRYDRNKTQSNGWRSRTTSLVSATAVFPASHTFIFVPSPPNERVSQTFSSLNTKRPFSMKGTTSAAQSDSYQL